MKNITGCDFQPNKWLQLLAAASRQGKQRLSPMLRAADGATPLSVAVGSKLASSVVVAKQLLEAQAAVDCADKKGNLPLHEVRRDGRTWGGVLSWWRHAKELVHSRFKPS